MSGPTRILLTAALGLTISASFGAPGPVRTPIPAPTATPVPTPKPPLYTVTEIAPGKTFTGNYMNLEGVIVGAININDFAVQHAAVYKNGKLTDLSYLFKPGISSEVQYVNREGDLAIRTVDFSVPGESTCYTLKDGHLTQLKDPAGTFLDVFGGLNNFGQTVGSGNNLTPTGGIGTAFGFFAGILNNVVKLPIVVESGLGYGNSINDFGQICGSITTIISPSSSNVQGYLRQPHGELIPLPNIVLPFAINDLGHVVGQDGPAANVYLYAKGKSTNLGHIPDIPTGDYFPVSVNNFDVAVGNTFTFTEETGWVFTNGQMYDLAKSVPGFNFEFANSPEETPFVDMFVNEVLDDGRILVIGDFFQRTFVLTPIPNKLPIRP
jgi:hypothetical protein